MFPDIVDEVVIAMRVSTWMTHALNHITDLRTCAQIQCEVLAHGSEGKNAIFTEYV